ncbi:AAA family ATPase [Trichormus sp. NMC-1]|uniref:AAA family ATPase n=1 Tax=Trichormus sp. NMC-1 TaxID=1853259 RepID=UPI0008DC0FA0|nr:AAA family ATPase [Trichormus sp. NMC-1]
MQKIIIKNFGAIQNAEIEVKKILVLIGEQASGKSTIARLIYFFKTLKDDLFSQIYQDKQKYLDIDSDILSPIRQKFYKFFGPTNHLRNFEIVFYYSLEKDKYIKLTLERNKEMKIIYTALINEDFKNSASGIKLRLRQEYLNSNYNIKSLINEEEKIKYAQQLYTILNELFESEQTDSLFIISGRSATVSYSDLFEKYLFASIQSSLSENILASNYERNSQKIDEILMLQFMKKVIKTRDIFNKFGNIEELTFGRNITLERRRKLSIIINKIDGILKGKYYIDTYGNERIRLDNEANDYVYLSNASSGQQESIRILQDIFLNILDDVKVLRILEEPEAHLFPVAQKQLIELLALMVNQNDDNQLIITTHSPYVLTVFNNLLFANRVVEKNPSAESEVTEIIHKDCWLNARDFSAYSLGNQSVSETTNSCESIFNTKKGTIKQNYLDTVSEILGGDFQALYSIHARTFARR